MKKTLFLFLLIGFECFSQKPNLKYGLIANYSFDNNATDASGNENEAVQSNNISYTYDRFLRENGACLFGNKSFMSVKNAESFGKIETEDAISLSFWFKIDKIQPAVLPIISKFKTSTNEKWSMQINENGFFEFTTLNNKTISFKCILKETSWKQWHNIVFTYSNANEQAKLYIDGELSEEKKFSESIGTTNGNLFIGKALNQNSQIWEKRLIDELKIFNRVLTRQEVVLLFNGKADVNPPEIIITYPNFTSLSQVKVSEDTLKLKGRIIDENQVNLFINEREVKVNPNSFFEYTLPVLPGINKLSLVAIDSKQNKKTVQLKIEKKAPDTNSFIAQTNLTNFDNPIKLAPVIQNGKYYALIIGNNVYQSPEIKQLDEPIKDAEKLYEVLVSQYNFEKNNVIFLKNATYKTIIGELDRLSEMITPNDNLLIFYAGHGYWDEKKKLGYWLPSDAEKNNTASWLRNSTIQDYMFSIVSKHTLIIADACFSGGIFKTRSAFSDAPRVINKLYEIPSRKAMTSGTLKVVPDVSKFLFYLLKKLQDNTEPYISADRLFNSFRDIVMNNSTTEPQYGTIQEVGDEGGEFIFVKRK